MARSLAGPSAQDNGERPARTPGQGPGHATLKLRQVGKHPGGTARSWWTTAQGAALSRRSTTALGGPVRTGPPVRGSRRPRVACANRGRPAVQRASGGAGLGAGAVLLATRGQAPGSPTSAVRG